MRSVGGVGRLRTWGAGKVCGWQTELSPGPAHVAAGGPLLPPNTRGSNVSGMGRQPSGPVTPAALTCPLVQHVVEGAIGHPVADDDGVGCRGGLAGAQHWEHVGVRKDPAREATALRTGVLPTPSHCAPSVLPGCPRVPRAPHWATTNPADPLGSGLACPGGAGAHRSFGYSSLKSRLFRVVQSRIFSILMTMSLPCQRPFHS